MKRKQFLALIVCVSMLGCGCLGVCPATTHVKAAGEKEITAAADFEKENKTQTKGENGRENTKETDQEDSKLLEKVVSNGLTNESNGTKKETVYVKADASGNVRKTIVSEWIKNVEHAKELRDKTCLSNIENVMGDETFTQKDGELIWNSNGNDIYFQGTCDKQLPVEMKIEYLLDGKTMTPEELIGKSGHLEMRFHYINHEKTTVQIDEKNQDVYVPFVAVTGVLLDDEVFHDIEITNGTIMNDAGRQIAVGMAFPGLVESLNYDSDDEMLNKLQEEIRLPEDFTIRCEVKDFKMGMTLTMISSDIFSSLGLDQLDDNEDILTDMRSSMEELKDAGAALVDGTEQLKNGADQLKNGAGQLKDGSVSLYDGIVAYTAGVGQVAGGANALQDGTGKLSSGVNELKNGSAGLYAGADTLENGAKQVDAGAQQLKDGADSVHTGAGSLKGGIDSLCIGSAALKGGLEQLKNNTPSLVSGISQLNTGAASVDAGAEAVSAGVGTLVDSLLTAKAGLTAENGLIAGADGVHQILSGVDASMKAGYNETLGSDASVIAGLLQAKMQDGSIVIDETTGQMCMSSDTMNELLAAAGQVGANQVIDQVSGYVANADGIAVAVEDGLKSLNAGLDETQLNTLKQGACNLKQGTGQLASGANTLNTSVSGLTDGVNSLYDGAVALDTGAIALQTGATTLMTGTQALADGAAGLANGTSSLSQGTTTLKNGAGALDAGVGELQSGSNALKNGVDSLVGGIAKLNSNSETLKTGSKQLTDGAIKLENGSGELTSGLGKYDDGIREFKQEGLDKLTDLLDSDSTFVVEKLKALSQAAKDYRSYAGENVEGASVRFLIETEPVK